MLGFRTTPSRRPRPKLAAGLMSIIVALPANARYVDGQAGVPSIDEDICSLIQLSFDLAEQQAELDARHGNWGWFWRAVDEMREAMRQWRENGCDDYYGSIHSFRLVNEPDDLINHWNTYMRQVQAEADSEATATQTVLGSAIAVSTGLSVGYVVWLVRGGMLLSSLLSSIPAWQILDPLPVLAGIRDEDDSDDDESLASILEDKQKNDSGDQTDADDEERSGRS